MDVEERVVGAVIVCTFRLEKQLAVLATVLLSVLGSDAGESLSDGSSRFVGCQNALASRPDGFGVLDELFCVRTVRHCWR